MRRWHLAASSVIWRGRRVTWWQRRPFCVAGVGFGSTFTLCFRRGIWWHRPSLPVAGVALVALALGSRLTPWSLFVWQVWGTWRLVTLTPILCGRRGIRNSHILFQMHSINLLTHNLLTQNSLTRSVFHHLLSVFLPFPFRLHLSFSTYWKKLTCGVIRSLIIMDHLEWFHITNGSKLMPNHQAPLKWLRRLVIYKRKGGERCPQSWRSSTKNILNEVTTKDFDACSVCFQMRKPSVSVTRIKSGPACWPPVDWFILNVSCTWASPQSNVLVKSVDICIYIRMYIYM